jgi:predicted alternative tryptophan synthase beta-subunit
LEDIKENFADFVIAPLVGGISKYGVTKRFDLLARDASGQAEKRISIAQVYSAGSVGSAAYNADVSDTRRLIRQAKEASKRKIRGR